MYVGVVLNCGVETLQTCLIGDPPLPPNPQKSSYQLKIYLFFMLGSPFTWALSRVEITNSKFIISTWEDGKGTSFIPC